VKNYRAVFQSISRRGLNLGLLTVLVSALFFTFQNVIVRVLFTQQRLLGLWPVGGYVTPNFPHSFLLMAMRTLWVVPLMALLAGRLYPQTWSEVRRLPQQRPLLGQALLCGGLMFTYLVLLYIAIGLIPAGVALTLFFSYPLFTGLLSWWWFGDRPGRFRYGVMALVILGTGLTAPQTLFQGGVASPAVGMGSALAVASGLAFAFYTVLAQKSFQHIHPVPFTWISFATTLALSLISLVVWPLPTGAMPWQPLWVGSLLSALFTLVGHLLNNLGIRQVGAADAAIMAATNPALTVVLAWVTIRETLSGWQILGVVIVTAGVILLSQEKRWFPKSSAKPSAS
jgi:drug/metabolite transporter (DMT)-like permease